MFNKAYNIANKFTHPLIVTMRFYDKTVVGGLGSFVIINKEGWCMTAAHNFGAAFTFNQHHKEYLEYQTKINQITTNLEFNAEQKKELVSSLKINSKWLTDFSVLLGGKPMKILQYYLYGENDFALFKVDPKEFEGQAIFPKFMNPANISPGTSLCKLGFPFVEVKPSFDENTKKFSLPANLLPLPLFPIEGIYTRNLLYGKTKDGSMDILYLETSSPGLKGQSGGPIFDTEGNIYAIQSQNVTIPLGFTGTVEVNNQKIEENQFINVGIGVHPKTIEFLMKKHEIKYAIAE
jgi:hypothetical protein